MFDGGFDIEQASLVGGDAAGGDVLDGIMELADQSLLNGDVVQDGGARIGGLRFRMLETIRSFALRELARTGETATIRARHAAAFCALAETGGRHLPGGDQARWIDRLDEDHANLRSAIEWSIEQGPVETAQRMAAALWRYWQFGGHLHEGRVLAERVAALAPEEPTTARLWALGAAGGVAYWQADSPVADAFYREQLVVARQVGDLAGEADAMFNLASTEFVMGDHASSLDFLMRARALYERIGDEVGAARTRWGEHNVLVYQDRMAEAMPILDEMHARFSANGDVMYQALTAGSIAFVNILGGDFRTAMDWGGRSLAMYHSMRDKATATITLAAGAILCVESGQPRAAATLLGAHESLGEQFGVRPPAGLGYLFSILRPIERTVEAMRAEEYAAAYAEGARMTLDEAVAYALETMARLAATADNQPAAG